MRSPTFLALSCWALSGCNTAVAEPQLAHRAERPAPSAKTKGSARDAPTEATFALGETVRAPFGTADTVRLPFRLVSVVGASRALVVAEEPLARQSHVRAIAEDGGLGLSRTLAGRFVASAIGAPDVRLVTSDGATLYVETLDGTGTSKPLMLDADDVVALGGKRLAFVEERDETPRKHSETATPPKPPDVATKPPPNQPHATKPPPGKPHGARPAHLPQRRPSQHRGKPKAPVHTPPPPPSTPTPVRWWLHPLADDGSLGEPIDTQLAFGRPMPGMGIVALVGTARGARALWYEPEPAQRVNGRFVPFAQLMTAELDALGKKAGGATPVVGGPRQFGFIDGHLRPRVFTRGDAALYLGRHERPEGRGVTREWEARWLDRPGEVTANDALWLAAPHRALEAAPLPKDEVSFYERVLERSPSLAEPEHREEPGRVAWANTNGYFVSDGTLFQADRAARTIRALPHPFESERTTVAWASFALDGSAIARTSRELVTFAPDGARDLRPLDGDAVPTAKPASVARVGRSWWALLPAPVDAAHPGGLRVVRLDDRLEVPSLSRRAFAATSSLVGGASRGMFVTLERGSLVLVGLAPDGTTHALAEHTVPIGAGFAAVAQPLDGALLVGPSQDGVAHAVAIDANGSAHPVASVDISLPPGRIETAPLPEGGALVWVASDPRARDTTPQEVAWLDGEGRPRARAAWPRDSSGTSRSCSAGRPLPSFVPSPAPGQFVRATLSDACVTGLPAWTTHDLRWLGTRDSGLARSAERVSVPWPENAGNVQVQPTLVARPAPRSPANAGASAPTSPCPADMVRVGDHLCVDRFEVQLVDERGMALSPYHAIAPNVVRQVEEEWTFGRLLTGNLRARALPLPPLLRPADALVAPVATSRAGVVPSGYLSGALADTVCRAAGKRLCTRDEWTFACRGEEDRDFPYGVDHEQGACNVNRYAHPAATLHRNAAVGHLDPRLNLVEDEGEPMLRPTGSTPRCVSRWGNDGVYDMVGNLDEWIDDEDGAFAGGFYARSTRKGCGAVITVHPRRYFDYSLGTRCCLTP